MKQIEINGSFSFPGREEVAKNNIKEMLSVWQKSNFKALFLLTSLNYQLEIKYIMTKNENLYYKKNSTEIRLNKTLKEIYTNKKYWLHKKLLGVKAVPRYKHEDLEVLGELTDYEIKKIGFKNDAFLSAILKLKFKDSKRNGLYRINFLAEKGPRVLDENANFRFYPQSIRKIKGTN